MNLDGCGVFASLLSGRVLDELLERRETVGGVSVSIRFLSNIFNELYDCCEALKTALSERYSMSLRQSSTAR
jgi:hypothetical protein